MVALHWIIVWMKTAVVCMPTTVSAFQFNSQQQRQQQGLLYDKDSAILETEPQRAEDPLSYL